MKPQIFTATVSSVARVVGKFYVAKLALTSPKAMQFLAGQYAIFKIGPPKVNHTLSIASAPASDGMIEILQSVAPMGEGSKWMLGLKAGDPVQFFGPLGKFSLQKESPKQKVFVATGCGVAPLRSMILDYLETGGKAQVLLYWGLRFESDLFWQEELEDLAMKHPNFHFMTTLSKPGASWTGEKGRVTAHVIKETPDVKNAEFYLCGSRQMIVDMRNLLGQNEVPQGQIYTETFF